jgi:hypothetical protein
MSHISEDDDSFRYFEIDLIQIAGLDEHDLFSDLTYLNIKEITTVIRGI